jgi:hypothetical protein
MGAAEISRSNYQLRGNTVMPKPKESLRIEIIESTNENQRVITAVVTAPIQDFLLPDLLAERKAITPLDENLKLTIKTAVEAYLSGAENLVAGLAANRNRHGENGKPQASEPKQPHNSSSKTTKAVDADTGVKREASVDKRTPGPVVESAKPNTDASVIRNS